jgi:RNA polymerase sigma-70 factor (ECF subfamily)
VEGRPPPERELVRRARSGDGRAFEELVRPHWETAVRLAYLITGSHAEAEDASQEALVKAWRALGRFRSSRPLRPWLLRIVANEARNRRRASGRRARLELRAAGEQVSGDAAPSPEALAVAADELRRIVASLDELPEQARLVLGCRYLLDLSEAETAAVLGVRRGTVKSRTSRALGALRELHG